MNECHQICRRAFEGLMHVWRVTAYYMGVEDSANLVMDDYNETRRLLDDIGHFIVLPAILSLDKISIFMGKNVALSSELDYHVILYLASRSRIKTNTIISIFHTGLNFSLWS